MVPNGGRNYHDPNFRYSHITPYEGRQLNPYLGLNGNRAEQYRLPSIRGQGLALPPPPGGWGPRWRQRPDAKWYQG
jgi:hypothetical protein